jgi:hypothetical protein
MGDNGPALELRLMAEHFPAGSDALRAAARAGGCLFVEPSGKLR